MKRFGLVGYPLSHSFSEPYHTAKYKELGIEATYRNFPLSSLQDLPLLIHTEKLDGFNVTIPYKEKIIPYLHAIDPMAQSVGAVNCVRIINEQLWGHNTDIIGFERSLSQFAPDAHRAIVFGTGGASKAICHVLHSKQISFIKVSRNEILDGITYADLSKDLVESSDLLINTTPIGTYPHVDDFLPINYSWIHQRHFAYDLVYNPAVSKFLYFCQQEGAQIKNGLEMLQIQADESIKLFMNES